MRKRLLNPELFRDEELATVPVEARYLYTGLWCIADREGRLEDRPARIKADVFPYDDLGVPMVDQWLTMLCQKWIVRYVVDGKPLIQIRTFLKHQRPHPNEAKSVLAAIPVGEPRVNHGDPLVNPPQTLVDQCQQMSVGIRYTVSNTPLPPAGGESASPRKTRKRGQPYTPEFDRWFAKYPKPEKKREAFNVWLKMTAVERRRADIALDKQLPAMRAKILKDGTDQYLQLARTWLTAGNWADDGEPTPSLFPVVRQPDPGPRYESYLDVLAREKAALAREAETERQREAQAQ